MKTFLENLEALSLARGTSGDEGAVKKLIYDRLVNFNEDLANCVRPYIIKSNRR